MFLFVLQEKIVMLQPDYIIMIFVTTRVIVFSWHEGLAKRGSNEICTCLYTFLVSLPSTIMHEVVLFSDNCAGQNKNKFIASLQLYCMQTVSHISKITHKFLITGHTQNENDAMHATTEREKKRILRSGPITLPSQWVSVIKTA